LDFPCFLCNMVIQSNLRLANPRLHSSPNLHDFKEARVQQLLLLQILHKWIRAISWSLLRNRIHQEGKCRKQNGPNNLYLFSSRPASNSFSTAIHTPNTNTVQSHSTDLPHSSHDLQPHNMVQKEKAIKQKQL
jgi:hypothetical protein